jgi:threonine synthase
MSSYATRLQCVNCDAEYPLDSQMFEGCPSCKTEDFASSLSPDYDYGRLSKCVTRDYFVRRSKRAGIWRYEELLPVREDAHRITLSEGSTPLVRCDRWATELGLKACYIKDEGRNPTWSFKDRHAAVSVSAAVQQGAKAVTIATSGNHGAATAAYAAKAGLSAFIFTYPGYYQTMRTLIQVYGGCLFCTSVEGRWVLMGEGIKRYAWYPIGNLTTLPTCNPVGHDGYKTIAYEICEDLRWQPPDFVIVPSGFSEGLYGIWKGFRELRLLGLIERTPRMVSAEPAAGGPLALAVATGERIVRLAEGWSHQTVARGIAVSTNSYLGVLAVRESGGVALTVPDEDTLAAQKQMAHEGVYAECTAATAGAGLNKLATTTDLQGAVAVVVNSSCGIKDFALIAADMPEPPTIEPDFAAFEEAAAQVYGASFS